MKAEKTSWEEKVLQQLKTETLKHLSFEIEEDVEVFPYETQTSVDLALKPTKDIQFIAPLHFNNEFADAYIGTMQEEVSSEKRTFLTCKSFSEIIPQDQENVCFVVDLFAAFETQNSELNLTQELEVYHSFSTPLKAQIKFAVEVALHGNAGANFSLQIAIALAKLHELTTVFSEDILSKCIIFVAQTEQYITEIAKLKALKISLDNYCKSFNINELNIQIIAESSTRNKTTEDEENNLIRSTLELSSAILGGSDYFKIQNFSSKKENEYWSHEVTYKQSLILAHESILNFYSDALNGSYSLNHITEKLALKAWKTFQEIEKNGGYIAEFLNILLKINDLHNTEIAKINSQEKTLIGYNLYGNTEFEEIPKRESKESFRTL